MMKTTSKPRAAENRRGTAAKGTGEQPHRLPAVPHEPTVEEVRAIASYQKRKAALPKTPAIVCNVTEPDAQGNRKAFISVDHPDHAAGYQMISDALGSGDMTFTCGLMHDAVGIATTQDGTSAMERVNYAMSIVKGIKPRDHIEAVLGIQIAAIHLATVKAAARLSASTTTKGFELYERSLNKLARTATTQVEALKRYRSKGSQRIVVERVNVAEGGQAIVGNVAAGNRGAAE